MCGRMTNLEDKLGVTVEAQDRSGLATEANDLLETRRVLDRLAFVAQDGGLARFRKVGILAARGLNGFSKWNA